MPLGRIRRLRPGGLPGARLCGQRGGDPTHASIRGSGVGGWSHRRSRTHPRHCSRGPAARGPARHLCRASGANSRDQGRGREMRGGSGGRLESSGGSGSASLVLRSACARCWGQTWPSGSDICTGAWRVVFRASWPQVARPGDTRRRDPAGRMNHRRVCPELEFRLRNELGFLVCGGPRLVTLRPRTFGTGRRGPTRRRDRCSDPSDHVLFPPRWVWPRLVL